MRTPEVEHALDNASSYEEWLQAAQDHDRLTGLAAWREDDESPHYEASALRADIARMRELRTTGKALELARHLDHELGRQLNDLSSPELYDSALAGTKHLVEAYLETVESSLRWLAATEIVGLSRQAKTARFQVAEKVFGRSALLLSGGATWGFHHLGVVKALMDLGLLPHILSGASTGAMIAAGVCTRSDAELRGMFEDTDQLRLDGLLPFGLRKAWDQGAWLDPARLYEVLLNNVGGWTFAEAFARSGRALNISVSPTRSRQKPRLLCHLTSPDVLVASAALASSALPTLFPPIELRSRGPDGEEPYVAGERWVDGSLYGDLPKLRLARLHNVNHFVVSQTNPHVMPFLRRYDRQGLRTAVMGAAGSAVRHQSTLVTDIARRAAPGPLRQLADQAHALVSQDYSGDILLHPRFRPALLTRIATNPTREDLADFIREGERSVWPRVAAIRDQTRIGRTFRSCLSQLGAKLA